jgi:hypothetical protein
MVFFSAADGPVLPLSPRVDVERSPTHAGGARSLYSGKDGENHGAGDGNPGQLEGEGTAVTEDAGAMSPWPPN